jgi:DNA-directed RNA polymerase specialized sigma24 family protein
VQRLALLNIGRSPLVSLEHGSDHADDVARRELVDRALDGLKPAVRATLVLRHYYGYDYAQIGFMLGMSTGTVGSTLSRAHSAIRERLEARERCEALSDLGGKRGDDLTSEPSEVIR